jgi:hypothetical protein
MEYSDISAEYLIRKCAKISVVFVGSYNTYIIVAPSLFRKKFRETKIQCLPNILSFLKHSDRFRALFAKVSSSWSLFSRGSIVVSNVYTELPRDNVIVTPNSVNF